MKRSNSRALGSRSQERQRGAAAVEFAIVAPILLALVGGIVEFAHAYNLQISVTQAAREAAREMAIKNNQTSARAAGIAGSPGVNPASLSFVFAPSACSPNATARVTVTYTDRAITGIFGNSLTVTGVGAMRCNG